MTNEQAFIQRLAERHGEKLTVTQIARASGVGVRNMQSRASQLIAAGRVSREKRPFTRTEGNGNYSYFLTDEQLARHKADMKKQTKPTANAAKPEIYPKPATLFALPDGVVVVSRDLIKIPPRLRFLYNLRDNTIFSDHALLKEIITDYEVTLKKAAG